MRDVVRSPADPACRDQRNRHSGQLTCGAADRQRESGSWPSTLPQRRAA